MRIRASGSLLDAAAVGWLSVLTDDLFAEKTSADHSSTSALTAVIDPTTTRIGSLDDGEDGVVVECPPVSSTQPPSRVPSQLRCERRLAHISIGHTSMVIYRRFDENGAEVAWIILHRQPDAPGRPQDGPMAILIEQVEQPKPVKQSMGFGWHAKRKVDGFFTPYSGR